MQRLLPVVLTTCLSLSPSAYSSDRIVQSAALPVGYYDPKVQQGDEPFPGYAEECGFKIFLQSSQQVALAKRAEDGAKLIYIDPLLTKRGNEFHKAFLIAHECAHHRLGHTTDDGLALRVSSRKMVMDQELSADCLAAEMLSRAGLADFTKTMTARMARSGLFSPGRGYPAGIQRASIIQRCGAVGERHFLARGIKASVSK